MIAFLCLAQHQGYAQSTDAKDSQSERSQAAQNDNPTPAFGTSAVRTEERPQPPPSANDYAEAREAAKDKREERDLDAQESMADAAWAMFWTAVSQAVIGLVGLVVLVFTLLYAKKAAEEAGRAATAGEASAAAAIKAANAAEESVTAATISTKHQIRAYVSMIPIGVTRKLGTSVFTIYLRQKNNGLTPANEVQFYWSIGPHNRDFPLDFAILLNESSGINVVQPSDEFIVHFTGRGINIPKHGGLYFLGLIRYVDIFGEPRETEACWLYKADDLARVTGNEKEPVSLSYEYARMRNRAT